MRASDLVGAEVVMANGRRLGYVTGLRCTLDGGGRGPVQAPRLRALVVGHRMLGRSLGYQQAGQRGPALLNWLFRVLHRETHIVEWERVAEVADHKVRLTPASAD